ncbi:hypothetical protein P6P90_10065 [Ectobacillus antri]|jgi:hypothetical protein|uniref:Uncharacterized protein n=1 Tax=Ectobacillus antri TaxID=2486280 RepID=A0ABT6H770_9BACI|nr:hypothetical protein [Ectobacillus antri]MDG4656787.1 hypothetical protein [Ectobacillus antri]MDG5754316.1 hypothetical protein [Ectobacillus antri]
MKEKKSSHDLGATERIAQMEDQQDNETEIRQEKRPIDQFRLDVMNMD